MRAAVCAVMALALCAPAAAAEVHQNALALRAEAAGAAVVADVDSAEMSSPSPAAVSRCRLKWKLYKQCSAPWASHPLGTSTTETICAAGCAMSDVAMSLATYNITIPNKAGKHEEANPGTLNSWLTRHGGYVETDLIVWNSIHTLSGGKLSLDAAEGPLTAAKYKEHADRCMPQIVNVRGGTHWVLVHGVSEDGKSVIVNDPGFNQNSYLINGILHTIVYKVKA